MPISFTQNDTNVGSAPNESCTPGTTSSFSSFGRAATDGGTPGTGTLLFGVLASSSNIIVGFYKLTIASGVTWEAGTWTWRFNVVVSNMNLTLNSVYICRVNSSNVSQDTIGSATGLGINLGTTGVKSGNITGIAQTPSAGDYVGVYLLMSNSSMNNQTGQSTPDQNIDSPFTIAIIPNKIYNYNQAVKRAAYW